MTGDATLCVITPYSPFAVHGHAADDIGPEFYAELAKHVRLTVLAPVPENSSFPSDIAYEVVHLPPSRTNNLRYFGVHPAAARKDWSRTDTANARRFLTQRNFDYIHVEYMQPLTAVSPSRRSTSSLTLHDIGEIVSLEKARKARGALRIYRSIEAARIAQHEKHAVRSFRMAFALSTEGQRWIDAQGGRGMILRLGRKKSEQSWSIPGHHNRTFVFAGALWRDANQHTARWLITEVAPRLAERTPEFEIRILGDGAPTWFRSLCEQSPNIKYVGKVKSFEEEYIRARAVLAPTVFSAGVLLKAQKALECGAPLIANSLATGPLNLNADVHCLVGDDADEFASQMLLALNDTPRLSTIASQGRDFWLKGSSWQTTSRDFLTTLGTG